MGKRRKKPTLKALVHIGRGRLRFDTSAGVFELTYAQLLDRRNGYAATGSEDAAALHDWMLDQLPKPIAHDDDKAARAEELVAFAQELEGFDLPAELEDGERRKPERASRPGFRDRRIHYDDPHEVWEAIFHETRKDTGPMALHADRAPNPDIRRTPEPGEIARRRAAATTD